MSKSLKMVMIAMLIGVLIVAAILTFISLGATNPVPWIIIAVTLAIPFIIRSSENKHFVSWKESYSVGIDSIDDDHKKLLSLINQFQTAVHYQTGEQFEKEALDELVNYTQYHFKREEEMMEEFGYADLEPHKAKHRAMIDQVERFIALHEEKGHEVLEEAADYLKQWLIEHINGTDKEYSGFLIEKGAK